MRERYRVLIYSSLLLLSFLALSIALESLGEVPKLVSVPPPPFADSFNESSRIHEGPGGGSKIAIDSKIPINLEHIATGSFRLNITGVTGTPYLRTRVGEVYNGYWTINQTEILNYTGQTLNYDIESQESTSYIYFVNASSPFSGFIPETLYTNELKTENKVEFYPSQIIFYSNEQINKEYQVTYTNYYLDEETLNNSHLKMDEKLLAEPKDIRDQIYPLAIEAIKGQTTDYGKLKALESYLTNNYVYNANYTEAPANVDPVLWFLFNEKQGVCIQFNSALVLMARSIGLPMRLVAGYRISPFLQSQVVTPNQSHAWAEAEFEGCGWVTFDATPTQPAEPNVSKLELIPTITTITEQPSSCFKGDHFNVVGTVTDPVGRSVNGLTVLVYVKQEKNETGILCSKGLVVNGVFNIDCTIPIKTQPGPYLVQAATIGNQVYNGSRSDPPLNILARTNLNCTIPVKVINGRNFQIKARLEENNTRMPIPDSNCIVEIDGQRRVYTTNINGEFTISGNFNEPRTHTIRISYQGTEYCLGSEVSGYINSIPLVITPDPLRAIVRGEKTSITGIVHAEEVPGDNEDVTITLVGAITWYEINNGSYSLSFESNQILECQTDAKGFFNSSVILNPSQTLRKFNVTYVLLSNGYTTTKETEVCMRPHLSQLVQNVSSWRNPFTINAFLSSDVGEPMANQNITLMLGGKKTSILTDSSGKASFMIRLDRKPDGYKQNYTMAFAGGEYILPVTLNDTIEFMESWGTVSPVFGILVTLLQIGATCGAIYLVWRITKNHWLTKDQADVRKVLRVEHESLKRESLGVFKLRGENASIDLELIDLAPGLPYIWGMCDDLRVKIKLETIAQVNGIIKVRFDKNEEQLDLGETLQRIKTFNFAEKGVVEILFSYENLSTNSSAETKLSIKIVDYREEIVQQFQGSYEEQIIKANDLNTFVTARELLHKLEGAFDQSRGEALKTMVMSFEEADYSHHLISRSNYEVFYKSKLVVDSDDVDT